MHGHSLPLHCDWGAKPHVDLELHGGLRSVLRAGEVPLVRMLRTFVCQMLGRNSTLWQRVPWAGYTLPKRYFLSELPVIWLPLTCPHTCGIGLGNQDILSYKAMLWHFNTTLCARLLAEVWVSQEKLNVGLTKGGRGGAGGEGSFSPAFEH